jgi:hypothetical protein
VIVACAVAGGALEYEPGVRDDGISFTDYRLLLKEIGTDQGIEIISAEHLLFDYISRPVAREIELCTWIRADCESLIANACAGTLYAVQYGAHHAHWADPMPATRQSAVAGTRSYGVLAVFHLTTTNFRC